MSDYRYLTLIRHAKSSWEYAELADKDRPLAKRGKKSVEKMAAHNHQLLKNVETFYCSTAERAVQTIELFSRFADIAESKIDFYDALYTFEKTSLIKFIKKSNNQFNSIALVGHNPAFTDLVNYFIEDEINNIPTCGLVRLRFDCQDWRDIEDVDCRLLYFDTPKNH